MCARIEFSKVLGDTWNSWESVVCSAWSGDSSESGAMATAMMASRVCSWNSRTAPVSTSKPHHAQSIRPRATYSISSGLIFY